jgi:hypothetical protein
MNALFPLPVAAQRPNCDGFSELETAEESAFHALLATRPMTNAGAIACVEHVADCGLATDEMRTWLAMLIESPLVAESNSQRRITQ